jgi:hypothetical protein
MTDDMPPLPYPTWPGKRHPGWVDADAYSKYRMYDYARRYALAVLEQIERDAVTYRDVEQRVVAEIERLRGAG